MIKKPNTKRVNRGRTHRTPLTQRIKRCSIHKHKLDVRILDYTNNKKKPAITYSCFECRNKLINNRMCKRLLTEKKTRLERVRRLKKLNEMKDYWHNKTRRKNVLPNKIK